MSWATCVKTCLLHRSSGCNAALELTYRRSFFSFHKEDSQVLHLPWSSSRPLGQRPPVYPLEPAVQSADQCLHARYQGKLSWYQQAPSSAPSTNGCVQKSMCSIGLNQEQIYKLCTYDAYHSPGPATPEQRDRKEQAQHRKSDSTRRRFRFALYGKASVNFNVQRIVIRT